MSQIYDDILNSSNIQSILEYYGIPISKNKCLCPFHNDKHPSMSIHPNRGIAKCFSCGAGGNAISFIQKYENEINHNSINVRQAMQKAIDIQGLNITIPNTPEITLTEEQKELQKSTNILKDVISLNENNLNLKNNESIDALKYLNNRKISLDTIKSFHIGYSPINRTYTTSILNKKYDINELINVGVSKINENGQYSDIFYGRIVIPIFDPNGNPVGFGARTLNNNIKPKYLNTKANDIFNKSGLLFNYHKAKSYARNDEIIIVEGYMDVISAKQMKMDNVVGIMGTALTDEHIKLLKKLKCEVTLALDNDEAGKDAMVRIIPELLKAKLKVNVLDISKLGDFKDFGDLQIADSTREKIYKTKISAFTFLMQQKYAKNTELTVENIHNIHNKMWKDGLLKNTKDTLNFIEYISKNTNFTNDEIERIIKPREVTFNNRVDRYKDTFFYYYILNLIKNYAIKNQNNILLKYIESGKLKQEILSESINNPKYLKDDELTINLSGYIKEFIFNTEDYINFKSDKSFILENLLNNAKSFDSKGNIVNIELNLKQKELVLKQYNESFDKSIKEYIENNLDEFEEIFIANNNIQFEKLFPKTYKEAFKEQAISRFKNDGVMEAVRYGLAYSEDMKQVMSRQFVNNNKYKTLLVFNNNNNILELTPENIKQESQEVEKTTEITTDKEISKEISKKDTSIFLKLNGKEKETSQGMYIPVNNEKAVYVPRELYKKLDNQQVELINSNSSKAIMSEYNINPLKQTKKWSSRLSLDEFYHKYFNLYEIKMDKEVVMA